MAAYKVKLIKDTFYNEEKTRTELAKFILSSDVEQLSFGKQCEKFEHSFSQYQARKHTVMVNSGSSANLAIIQALLNLGQIKKGDKVAFSALTWSTNVMPLIQLGLEPIPIDVERDTLNVSDTKLVEVLENYNVRVVFLTNLLGFCDDIDMIEQLCEDHNIILLEDNCESLWSVYNGRLLGNFSLASTFSFYVGHHLSTIEGGAICTDDDDLANMLRIVRTHGWDRNLSVDAQEEIRLAHHVNSNFYSRYTFYYPGYNFRPTEIQGFIGNKQLLYFSSIVRSRVNQWKYFKERIDEDPRFYSISTDHMDVPCAFAIPIVCKSQEIRDSIVRRCEKEIEIRPIVGGDMTQQPFFAKQNKYGRCLNAQMIHNQGLYFGNYPDMTKQEKEIICEVFEWTP